MKKFERRTKEEIEHQVYEEMRENTIVKIITNNVMIEAMKLERDWGNKGKKNLDTVQNIRTMEANQLQLEKDLELIESKLNA